MGKDQDHLFGLEVGTAPSSSSSSSSDESVENMSGRLSKQQQQQQQHQPVHRRLFDGLVVLDHLPETTPLEQSGLLAGSVGDGVDDCSGDELFLLPESVLGMDSQSFREDVRSVAPSLLPSSAASKDHGGHHHHNVLNHNGFSPHNSLDSTDSAKSLRLLEDSDGLRMARASEGCKTLWLCK